MEEVRIFREKGDFEPLLNKFKSALTYASNSYHVPSYEVEDLFQELTIALLDAARAYDFSREVSFKTYFYKCLQNRVQTLRGKSHADVETSFAEIVSGEGEAVLLLEDVVGSSEPSYEEVGLLLILEEVERKGKFGRDRAKKILDGKIKGYSNKQIGKEIGVSGVRVGYDLKDIKKDMERHLGRKIRKGVKG